MPTAPSAAATRPPRRAKARILLVEDERTIALTLRDDLADDGYDVTVLADGNDALRRLAAERFDAVISDLRLPGASGLDVLRCARQRQPDVRLLLVTAYAEERCAGALRAVRGTMLSKPFANDDVLAWLRAAPMR